MSWPTRRRRIATLVEMDAFDAGVLIYAAAKDHPEGARVRPLLATDEPRVGSALLLPELLTKPLRLDSQPEVDQLVSVLARLELVACDEQVARLAAVLGAKYALRAADAVHLATAVSAGAERFITNNRKDFTLDIDEVAITYPDLLPEPPTP